MKMTKRLLLPLLVLASLLVAAPASAAVTIGLGDQSPGTFTNPLFTDLKIKKVRYVIPWNTAQDPAQKAEVDAYITAARAARQEVLIHFSAIRGCFANNRYSRSSSCKAPTVKRFTSAFKAFKKAYPSIKVYGTWNEANHVSQPLSYKAAKSRGPKLAAQYYTALKKNCRGCKVVAGDLLSQSDMIKYAKAMNKALKGRAKLWGLHNYPDVNRKPKKTTGTELLLRTVPGEVWVTETGGIVSFDAAKGFNPSENNAVTALKRIFSIANKNDTKRRGNKSRITRLYPYNFIEAAGARFDAALLNPDGTPRKGYFTFKSAARKFKK